MRNDILLLLSVLLTIAGCDGPGQGSSLQRRANDAGAAATVRLARFTADQWSIGVADGWKKSTAGGWVYLESPTGAMLGIQRVEADSGPVTDESLRAFMQKGDERRQLDSIRLGPFTGYTLKSQDGVSVMRFWMVHAEETILSIVYEGAAGEAVADRPAIEAMLGSLARHQVTRSDAKGSDHR